MKGKAEIREKCRQRIISKGREKQKIRPETCLVVQLRLLPVVEVPRFPPWSGDKILCASNKTQGSPPQSPHPPATTKRIR